MITATAPPNRNIRTMNAARAPSPVAVSGITTAAATITELSFSAGGHFHRLVTSGTL
jgi:hypothetical protein